MERDLVGYGIGKMGDELRRIWDKEYGIWGRDED